MDNLDDDHGSETIRQYVRTHPDIDVHSYVKRGLNGLVYFGKRRKLNDEVALKFYWANPGYDASEEAVILRSIEHPNILKVYDLRFIKPNSAYFLSPRILGGDLQSHIDSTSISSREALTLVSGILSGVSELHSNYRLVHRDLKPSNILLEPNQKTAIVADLGAVKKIDLAQGYTTESKATLYYLPPECIVDKRYFFQSDIYQIGLIMFQLLNGFFPIGEPSKWLSNKQQKEISARKTNQEKFDLHEEFIKEKIYRNSLADLNSLPKYLDGKFRRILRKALNWDPTRRFRTCSDFLKEVHSLHSEYPSYQMKDDHLWIVHDSGREYRIMKTDDYFLLEKKLPGSTWRRDNGHDGTLESVLMLSRKP